MNTKRFLIAPLVVAVALLTAVGLYRPAMAAPIPDTIDFKLLSANASADRDWNWTIAKAVDQGSLTLSPGQSHTVNYTVVVNATPFDSALTVTGQIGARNFYAVPVFIYGFAVDGVPVSGCPTNFALPAGWTVNCNYSVTLPTISGGQVTGSVLVDPPLVANSETVPVAFSGGSETDECVDVTDSLAGFLGTVCASDGNTSFTFTYPYVIGPYADCGDFTVDNTATFTTNDNGETGSDDETVNIHVPCASGCTLTPGYWKTHSAFGPAPYDDTWAQIGENTTFFLSGQSYYGALWTSPSGGNAYYILAHAYIAAQLNLLNGADFSAAQAAFDAATALFNTYTPAQIGALRGNSPVRAQFVALAGTLDDYNNGLIGPGHCTE